MADRVLRASPQWNGNRVTWENMQMILRHKTAGRSWPGLVICPFILLAAMTAVVGCSTVEPWQRGNLAKPHMALDNNPIRHAAQAHVISSRQAMPSGGAGEGGGCGCY